MGISLGGMRLPLMAGIVSLCVAGASSAAHLTYYTANFTELNSSNVQGNAILIVDTDAQTLQVKVQAENLEVGEDHMMHIHGLFDDGGAAADSTTPTLANDTDGDGYIEVLEGVPAYGDILLPLGSVSTATGSIAYDMTFDLTDDSQFMSPVTGNSYTADDLFPLKFREIVIHGKTVATSEGMGTGGEVDGSGGYKGLLPVASAEIIGMPAIPEPTTIVLAGIAVLGGLFYSKRR